MGQDPGQGGYPSGSAAVDLRREAVGGWSYSVRLQHPEGVHSPSGSSFEGRCDRAHSSGVGAQVQLRSSDLPYVLRSSSGSGHQLQEEEVRSQQPVASQEEAEVDLLQGDKKKQLSTDLLKSKRSVDFLFPTQGIKKGGA